MITADPKVIEWLTRLEEEHERTVERVKRLEGHLLTRSFVGPPPVGLRSFGDLDARLKAMEERIDRLRPAEDT